MKKTLFILITALTLNNTIGLAQDSWKLVKDTLLLANGAKFVVHDKIKLGYGSNPRKDFQFVYTSPMSIAGLTYLGSGWSGMTMVVKDFKEYKNKRLGNKVYLILGGGNIVNYWCDIQGAIDNKEVIVSGLPDSKGVQPTQSLADELKKLKDLLDSGALTKDEYDAAKKKLLN